MAAASPQTGETCFHCGLPMPKACDLHVEVLGAERPMCCVGCLAVAETLVAQGLEHWYTTREAPAGEPAELVPDVLARSDFLRVEEVDGALATSRADGLLEARFVVEGITCAACVWLIERHLGALDGVEQARVSSTSHRLRLRWDPERCRLEDVVVRLAGIGFVVHPDEPDEALAVAERERRSAVVRIGIAALATMNVMTYAVALYMGDAMGMTEATRSLLRSLCWLVTTPVVCVSALPFFRGAIRDLSVARPGMDVPVALAIGGGYAASAWAVFWGAGAVYFESVCMFTLFLLVGRFVEMNVRHGAAARSRRLLEGASHVVRRLVDGVETVIDVGRIRAGDRLRVLAGETLPVDARVVRGEGLVEEAILTGEPWPRTVAVGDWVRAGSVAAEAPLEVEAATSVRESSLAGLAELIDRAQSEKPAIARRADRVASVFVSAVIGIAALTAAFWWTVDPSRILDVTLAVLVATCPCALGLATPAALAAATEGLAKRGFVITRADVIERLARLDRIVFDKTGTLTEGRPRVEHVVPLRGVPPAELKERAAALEQHSSHPFAHAFPAPSEEHAGGEALHRVGRGVEGKLAARLHRIGRPDWVAELASTPAPAAPTELAASTWILLGDEVGPLGWFGLGDPLRREARGAIARLREAGLALELSSGDPSPGAGRLARALGLERRAGPATPEQKLARVRELARAGERVAFVGDGLNDGPVVRAADVSIAMGGGSDGTRLAADALLWHDDLGAVPDAIRWARRAQRVVRQNFGWAIAYNVAALPLAIAGLLAPWVAALGMSVSSLVVTGNSMRLRRAGKEGRAA